MKKILLSVLLASSVFATSQDVRKHDSLGAIIQSNSIDTKYYLCQVDDPSRGDNTSIGFIKYDSSLKNKRCYTKDKVLGGHSDGALHYKELFFPPEKDIKRIQIRNDSDLIRVTLDSKINSYNLPISTSRPFQYIGINASSETKNSRNAGLLCIANNQEKRLGYLDIDDYNKYYCATTDYISADTHFEEKNFDVLLFNKQNMPSTKNFSRSSSLGKEAFLKVITHIQKNIYLNMPAQSVVASLNTIPSTSGLSYKIVDVIHEHNERSSYKFNKFNSLTPIQSYNPLLYLTYDKFDSAFSIQNNGDITLIDNSIISGNDIVNLTIKVEVQYLGKTYHHNVHLSFGKAAKNTPQGPVPTHKELHLTKQYFQNLVALMNLPNTNARNYGYSTPPDNIMLGLAHTERKRLHSLGRLAVVSGWTDKGTNLNYYQTINVGKYVLANQLFEPGFAKVFDLNTTQINNAKNYKLAEVPEYILTSFYPFNSHYPVNGSIPNNIYQESINRINTDGPIPGLHGDPMEMEVAIASGLGSYVYYALTHFISEYDDGFSRSAKLGRVIAWDHWPHKFLTSPNGTISDDQARKVFFYAIKNGFIHPYTYLPVDNSSLSKSDETWNNIMQFQIPTLKKRVKHPASDPTKVSLFQIIGSFVLGAALNGAGETPAFDESISAAEIYSGEEEGIGGVEKNKPIVKGSDNKYYKLSTYKGGTVFKGRNVSVSEDGYSVNADNKFINIDIDFSDIPKNNIKKFRTLKNLDNPSIPLTDNVDSIRRYEINDVADSSIRTNHTYSIKNIDAIKVNDKYYRVKWDSNNQTYRLNDGNPTSYKPPVAFDDNEGWSFHNNVGLKGGAPINYHGVENGLGKTYSQLNPENPSDFQILNKAGFIENGVIDQDFMEEEGGEGIDIEESIPLKFKQTSEDIVSELVSKAKAGDVAAGEKEVIIWRGTTGFSSELIARNKTAGGGNSFQGEVGSPTENEARLQVALGGKLPEYSTNPSVTDRFSRGHFAVVIKIKARYLTRGSVSESGWVVYKNAPVSVEYILDRTSGMPETISHINGS
ncbi:DUF4765 family protein [Arcobacter sp. YIC-80]|uniref:DUF4765 family protein n=1 Tax=Arcobacter sp. YIC-80 TaxID=3376683 RepID=UPI00384C28D2